MKRTNEFRDKHHRIQTAINNRDKRQHFSIPMRHSLSANTFTLFVRTMYRQTDRSTSCSFKERGVLEKERKKYGRNHKRSIIFVLFFFSWLKITNWRETVELYYRVSTVLHLRVSLIHISVPIDLRINNFKYLMSTYYVCVRILVVSVCKRNKVDILPVSTTNLIYKLFLQF